MTLYTFMDTPLNHIHQDVIYVQYVRLSTPGRVKEEHHVVLNGIVLRTGDKFPPY